MQQIPFINQSRISVKVVPKYSYFCFMNRRIVTGALFVVLFSSTVKSQDAWNLKRSVEYAIENNISVKQADIQARLAEVTLKQSRLMQYPSASVSAKCRY